MRKLILSTIFFVVITTGSVRSMNSRCISLDKPLNLTPAIKVLFKGFMGLRFNGCSNPVEVGIPRAIGNHCFSMYVLKFEQGKDAEMLFSYWGVPKEQLWIGVYRPKYPGIHRYGLPVFDPATASKNDFGWTVDLEGSEYHNSLLQWDTDKLTPSIFITNGLFFTDAITDPSMLHVTRFKPGGAKDMDYRMIATQIAAGIDFDEDFSSNPIKGFATLRFGQEAQPFITLNWSPMKTTRYEIHIENEPLDPEHVMTSDFSEYYRIIKNDLTGKRYDFDFPGRGTNRIPCSPAIFGGQ